MLFNPETLMIIFSMFAKDISSSMRNLQYIQGEPILPKVFVKKIRR
jgi:hypothetical protein